MDLDDDEDDVGIVVNVVPSMQGSQPMTLTQSVLGKYQHTTPHTVQYSQLSTTHNTASILMYNIFKNNLPCTEQE
jgi:hypothetical protein